ncbi:hypothetical protein HK101_011300, partial [Irineochytrium annulatum]
MDKSDLKADVKSFGGGLGVPDSGTIRRPTMRRTIAAVDPAAAAEERRKLAAKDPAKKWLKIIPWFGIVPSLAICGLVIWLAIKSVPNHKYCLVVQDDFSSGTIDPNIWSYEMGADGFGNGEFQAYTNDPANAYVKNGMLYIKPTLTSDKLPLDNILGGYTWNLTEQYGCVGGDAKCTVVSNFTNTGMKGFGILPPVMSAKLRLNPQFATRYGKGEVRVKMPKGDWLWPAIWMMPQDESIYGTWPRGGEIDIVETRGNDVNYGGGGIDKMQSSVHFGYDSVVQKTISKLIKRRHGTLASQFHTIGWEWTPDYFLTWLDSPLRTNLYFPFKQQLYYYDGGFGTMFANGSAIPNLWTSSNDLSAPFDKKFYLQLNVAVGGTNGFFPDGMGNKPWGNTKANAMLSFFQSLTGWYNATWPQDDNRAMQIDYVKPSQAQSQAIFAAAAMIFSESSEPNRPPTTAPGLSQPEYDFFSQPGSGVEPGRPHDTMLSTTAHPDLHGQDQFDLLTNADYHTFLNSFDTPTANAGDDAGRGSGDATLGVLAGTQGLGDGGVGMPHHALYTTGSMDFPDLMSPFAMMPGLGSFVDDDD